MQRTAPLPNDSPLQQRVAQPDGRAPGPEAAPHDDGPGGPGGPASPASRGRPAAAGFGAAADATPAAAHRAGILRLPSGGWAPAAAGMTTPMPAPAKERFAGIPFIPRHKLVNLVFIGEGHFGKVHKADYDGTTVVLKELKIAEAATPAERAEKVRYLRSERSRSIIPSAHTNPCAKQENEFATEIENTFRAGHHPNIVRMMGVCKDTAGPTLIVLELCSGRCGLFQSRNMLTLAGSAEDLLRQGRLQTVPQKLKMLQEASAGLMHMHSLNLLHRDIALRNVLLRGDDQAQIADLGMAKELGAANAASTTDGARDVPIRWMAPVCASYNFRIDTADGASAGVTP